MENINSEIESDPEFRDAAGISDREYEEAAENWIYYGCDPSRDIEMER
jgi:hypothetical protein